MYGACETIVGAGVRWRAARRVCASRPSASSANPTPGRSPPRSRSHSTRAWPRCGSIVSMFFLHCNICADDEVYAHGNDQRASFATPWSQYLGEVVPAFEDLQRRGRIGRGASPARVSPRRSSTRCSYDVKPRVVQAITNLLDSPGGIRRYAEPPRPREIIADRERARRRRDGHPRRAGRRAHGRVRSRREGDASRRRRLPEGGAVPRRCARSSASTLRCSRTGTRSTWRASTPWCSA